MSVIEASEGEETSLNCIICGSTPVNSGFRDHFGRFLRLKVEHPIVADQDGLQANGHRAPDPSCGTPTTKKNGVMSAKDALKQIDALFSIVEVGRNYCYSILCLSAPRKIPDHVRFW